MYRDEIMHGIQFLSSIQNTDGGIPGLTITGTSACWTTAEALEAVLLSPYISLSYHMFVHKMVDYLLNAQISDGANKGGWPEFVQMPIVQTLSTGHALSALCLAENVINDLETKNSIKTALCNGFTYLNSVQNHDGGWSIEPEKNNESRALSTVIVLKGYVQNGYNCTNSKAVRDAISYLLSLKDSKTGGFSRKSGEEPDVDYTAKIISILIKTKQYTKSDSIIRKAWKYLLKDKSLKSLFSIKHESYISDNSAGIVVFYNNTPIDVMEALCLCDIYDHRIKTLANWVVNTQEDNGGWYLGGNRNPNINKGVITWTTNEGIFALSCCSNAFSEKYASVLDRKVSVYMKSIILLIIIITGFILHPQFIANNNLFFRLWNVMPNIFQKLLQITIISTAVLNIFSNYLYDVIKKIIKGGDT